MKISELPLAQSVSTSDDVPIDRSGVTYRVKYEALQGPPGPSGTIENLSVATTTLSPGSDPTVSYANNTITFGLSTGATGAAGVGVPSGGATGQVLKKKSGTNYDTEWANESGGGGGSVAWGSITGTLSDQTDLQNALNGKLSSSALLDLVYPIGSIYMSVNNVSPASFIGGTWATFAAGRVLVGVDTSDTDFDTVEETGGEKTHTLIVNEMPSHKHDIYSYAGNTVQGTEWSVRPYQNREEFQILGTACKNTGGSQPHNNLQPYITCYMWKRTA